MKTSKNTQSLQQLIIQVVEKFITVFTKPTKVVLSKPLHSIHILHPDNIRSNVYASFIYFLLQIC